MKELREKAYLYGVILAGGSGSRLWPLSRELYPKHFLKLAGEKSLLQATVGRIEKLIPPKNVFLVTNQKYLDDVKTQLNFFQRQKSTSLDELEHLLIEPIGRNTTAAIGLAAFFIYKQNPEAIMIVLPSDHLIQKQEEFLELLQYSFESAAKGYLVTFGIEPQWPETGYGYIKKGALIDQKIPSARETYLSDSFLEKPDAELAQRYFASGQYLWNSGIFVFKAKEFLRALRIFLPKVFQQIEQVSQLDTNDDHLQIESIYRQIEPISVDKGIMEKSDKVVVIPAQIGWSDVGSWDKIHQILPKDEKGNFADKKTVQIDCENSLLYGGKRLIAALGLKDIMVVDTDDALLVCHKAKTQKVKEVFEGLKNSGFTETKEPKTVIRPWGSWSVLLEGPGYKIKKFVVYPGHASSLQSHQYRSEHWVVVTGQALIQKGNESFFLAKDQSTFIPPQTRHRFSNPGPENIEIIEIQNGQYLGEDDILRFDDKYGRLN